MNNNIKHSPDGADGGPGPSNPFTTPIVPCAANPTGQPAMTLNFTVPNNAAGLITVTILWAVGGSPSVYTYAQLVAQVPSNDTTTGFPLTVQSTSAAGTITANPGDVIVFSLQFASNPLSQVLDSCYTQVGPTPGNSQTYTFSAPDMPGTGQAAITIQGGNTTFTPIINPPNG
jgi:hypothetical protein